MSETKQAVETLKKVELTLEENPTTGYRWAFQEQAGIRVDQFPFVASDNEAVGSGGTIQFSIESDHSCSVVFELRRKWESPETKPIRKVTVSVE